MTAPRFLGKTVLGLAATTLGLGMVAGLAMVPGTESPAAAQTTTTTCRDGQNRWLHVRNLSRRSLYYFQSRRPYSRDAWGDDLLGQAAIPSGQTVYIHMPSANCQCDADVKVTFENDSGEAGQAFEYPSVRYCSYNHENRALLIVDDRP